MRTAILATLWIVLLSSANAQDEKVYITKEGEYVIVRTEERSSGRGWVRMGVLALMLAFGGAAVAGQRTFRRPKNRPRPGSAATSIRKPVRPTFNKPKKRS